MWQTSINFALNHAPWFAGISVLSILASMVVVPWLVARLPQDYFCAKRRHPAGTGHSVAKMLLAGAKNLLGCVLVVAGVLLLFVPGQGLITIIAGMLLMNYPGKYALERWFVRRPRIIAGLNWLRARHGRRPLDPPWQNR